MNRYLRLLSILLVALMLAFTLSCDKDNDNNDTPTIPNFEMWFLSIWNQPFTLMLDVNYTADKETPAYCYVTLSSRGSNSNISLMLNNEPVELDDVTYYSAGNLYYGAMGLVDTSAPISYDIFDGTTHYTGVANVPQQINGTFPNLDPLQNYTYSWTYAPDNTVNPNFHVVDVLMSDQDSDADFQIRKQIDGSLRQYTINKSMWQSWNLSLYFDAYVDAYTYSFNNDDQVLTIGYTYDGYYYWKQVVAESHRLSKNIGKAMYYIDQDLKK